MTELDIGASAAWDADALPKPPTMGQHLTAAWDDFRISLVNWRMWLLLGMNDIRQRYRRSRLGQFWITLAMATTIVSLGLLYAYLFHQPLGEYLPYLGTSFVVWGLLSSIVSDACMVFIGAEGFLRQVPMAKSVFVHRMLVRNVVIFVHNMLILPPLFIIFGVPAGWSLLMALLGIGMILLNGIWIGLFLGTICARFRDMPQIIASVMQVAYFLTPVIWRRTQLPVEKRWISDLNPFQSFLNIVRDPLLGYPPPLIAWKVAGLVTVLGFTAAILFFARFRSRIVYWL